MGNYLENIRHYLRVRNIKNTYIELMTGWDKSKVSRILNGETELKYEEMDIMAKALGHELLFFLGKIEDMEVRPSMNGQIAFFAGNLDENDRKDANKLIEMFRFYDALTTINI